MNNAAQSPVDISVGAILSNGISIGVKNSPGILFTYILYLCTMWVPYLNIGTTIALRDLVAILSRGERFSPTFIFDDRYRRRLAEFFIMMGLTVAALIAAYATAGAAAVLAVGWMFSGPLFVDRGLDGLESLRASYRITDGHKLTILLSFLLLVAIFGILGLIIALTQSVLLIILVALAAFFFGLPIVQGMLAYIYGQLVRRLDEQEAGAEPIEPHAFG